MRQVKNIGVRVPPETHRKLKSIAEYEGRTINGQVLYLINQCIRSFEQQNGPIQREGSGE